ncbi:hypothetical protein [Blastococcus sp. Marseille-P5729]|uniref:hypothetical protein n=1 Tax=Blastococcus sp. Marseille-P5729 TaxID=2086582 RepID=UPI000D104B9D|nr:hypothetical protein [Blastococcus sp. Marseille-P5729]
MIDWLRYAVIACALLLTLLAYVDFRGRHAPRRPALLMLALSAALVVAQAVVAAVQMGRGHEMSETATFIGYLATNVIMLPAAAYVAYVERSRWSSVAMAVAGFVVAVLEVRLQQLWTR